MNVMMGRVRRQSGSELGFMHLHAEAGVGFAVQNSPLLVLP